MAAAKKLLHGLGSWAGRLPPPSSSAHKIIAKGTSEPWVSRTRMGLARAGERGPERGKISKRSGHDAGCVKVLPGEQGEVPLPSSHPPLNSHRFFGGCGSFIHSALHFRSDIYILQLIPTNVNTCYLSAAFQYGSKWSEYRANLSRYSVMRMTRKTNLPPWGFTSTVTGDLI